MPHLFVDISSHGFGHLAQVSPVLNLLSTRHPELRITLRTGLPAAELRARLPFPFTHIPGSSDFGFVMHNTLDIDLAASLQRYSDFHHNWPARVQEESAFLSRLQVDLVFSDVAYLPLAGARAAGIPCVAMCSLNWAELFADTFPTNAHNQEIYLQILGAYQGADAFWCLTPGLPMDNLPRRMPLGPICRLHDTDKQALAAQYALDAQETWILVAMGGMDLHLDMAHWPLHPQRRYFVPSSCVIERPDISNLNAFPFNELLAACDAIITKPGYGTYVEAACHGKPVLFVSRECWREQLYINPWLEQHTRALEISRDDLAAGRIDNALTQLQQRPSPTRPTPSGVTEAVQHLERLLYGQ